jgi:hypothetical protein
MKQISIFLLLVCLFTNCQGRNVQKPRAQGDKNENELLLKAYTDGDYVKCLEILKDGTDGRIVYSPPPPDYPIPVLFDICRKYLYDESSPPEIEELFYYYLKNRKEAFEDSIRRVHQDQTIGSYLARFAPVELLRQIAQEKININSPEEDFFDTAIRELGSIDAENSISSRYFNDLNFNNLTPNVVEEKKIRMELLLDAGADVTLIDGYWGQGIFHYFRWYPLEEDFTEVLDKMIEKGADLFARSANRNTCIHFMLNDLALDQNTELYLEYVISRGMEVTRDDLSTFSRFWSDYMKGNSVTNVELRRLERIKAILDSNVK